MEPKQQSQKSLDLSPAGGLRLRRIIVLEAVLVALGGMIIWGVASELGFFRAGLVIAIIIWVTVSPIIEIATVSSYRRSAQSESTGAHESPRRD